MMEKEISDMSKEGKELNDASSSKVSSSSSSVTSFVEHHKKQNIITTTGRIFSLIGRSLLFVWHWSVPYRSANRKSDPGYVAVWNTSLTDENIRHVLQSVFTDIPRNELPTKEEPIRYLIRTRLPPPGPVTDEKTGDGEDQEATTQRLQAASQKLLDECPEETWQHLPLAVRELLAAYNAQNLERKIDVLSDEPYHSKSGQGSINRSKKGIHKVFRMWRLGFKQAVSGYERVGVNIFMVFLAFSACYPDIAAGFLGERSYNQRSIGSRIATLCQLFSLFIYPYHSFWLLFNWSLERLIGAFVGNTTYALAAIVPAIHEAYGTSWFRFTLLGLSMTWQVGVQFTPTVRDYIVRLVTRRQMRRLRDQGETEAIHWSEVDRAIAHELTSHKAFVAQLSESRTPLECHDVPLRTRTERFIKFTATYSLGRPADQLIGLLKDDLEIAVNTYEDYAKSNPDKPAAVDKGHIEPPLPKIILVIFDAALFAYICYSFWTQPFTFNTTVAYGTVVVIKQAVLAAKRYQTAKGARRLFTNMVAFNLLGVFLVSTPVTINRDVLRPTGNFIALTLAMVFATLFLSEPIAPLILKTVEGSVAFWSRMGRKGGGSKDAAKKVDKSAV